ncbi:MAG: DUF2800 domain-containing protein [Synergistaceae bacterium]|nr:DUF2800 domain-containing protein [Synergistaceae bacterium]
MPPDAHAKLSLSGSSRWTNCSPSVMLESRFPQTTSIYAEEGTFAHELCEYKVNKYLHKRGLKRPQSERFISEEIDAITDTYAQFIEETVEDMKARGIDPLVFIEVRLDMSFLIPEGFGTSDCVMIGGDTLRVVDFKTGSGVFVDADHNCQMMLYGLGALHEYGFLYDIKTVSMTIVQPRLQNISTFEMPADDLVRWGEKFIRPRALMAFKGEGELNPGPHCRFCRAKSVCRACAEEALSLAKKEFLNADATLDDTNPDKPDALPAFHFKHPKLVDHGELETILPNLSRISKWIDDVFAYAADEAINHGASWAGYKVVKGRSVRKFADEKAVVKAANEAGFTDIYKRSLISLTEFEKLMGKKVFQATLGSLVYKPPGKLALVPDSDKREAVDLTGGAADFQALPDEGEEE